MSQLPDHLQRFASPVPVLDRGFVRLVDVLGDDGSVVTAARVTTGKGRSAHEWAVWETVSVMLDTDPGTPALTSTRWKCKVCRASVSTAAGAEPHPGHCVEGDRRLIRYMLSHNHVSSFEFAEIVLHIRLPIYVFRQLVRHWSWSFQEFSQRYSKAVDAIQVTETGAWRAQSTSNRQGSGETVRAFPEGFHMQDGYSPGDYLTGRESELHDLALDIYEERIAFGVAKEQARKDLPLSNYTDVYAKANLRDALNMLALRLDAHAQHEIHQYASAIAEIVQAWVPLTWEAFRDYRLEAVSLSRQQAAVLRNIVADWRADAEALAEGEGEPHQIRMMETLQNLCIDLTDRERVDLLRKIGLANAWNSP